MKADRYNFSSFEFTHYFLHSRYLTQNAVETVPCSEEYPTVSVSNCDAVHYEFVIL